jgi:thiamine monophosphate kinase
MKIYPCPFKDKNFKRNPQNLNWTLLGEDDFQILQKTSKKNGQNLAGSQGTFKPCTFRWFNPAVLLVKQGI